MQKIIFLTLSLFLLIACGTKHPGEEKPTLASNLVSITNNEDKGVKEILNFYGGQCEYSVGIENGKKYFELVVSKSEALEKLVKVAGMPASNVAYLFYKNLTNEKSKYDEIRVTLLFKGEQKVALLFPVVQLEKVTQRMQVAHKLVALIKEKKFDDLLPFLSDTGLISYDKNVLIKNLKGGDGQFGNVTDGFQPFGFRVKEVPDGREILHISGAIIRDKQSNEFSVDLDLNKSDDSIFIFEYKL